VEGYICEFQKWGAYLQNFMGGLRVSCGGATWRAAVGCADAMLMQG
jgi:hypothetical protein